MELWGLAGGVLSEGNFWKSGSLFRWSECFIWYSNLSYMYFELHGFVVDRFVFWFSCVTTKVTRRERGIREFSYIREQNINMMGVLEISPLHFTSFRLHTTLHLMWYKRELFV